MAGQYGKTIAILANGLDRRDIYPIQNINLFEQIIENGGLVLSEYIVGVKAQKYFFRKRNRIVSGLADRILVVEAKEKSGTLITVGYALEQGKDVFAVPGNIYNDNSKGTNNLIAEGARVFTKIEDLLEWFVKMSNF